MFVIPDVQIIDTLIVVILSTGTFKYVIPFIVPESPTLRTTFNGYTVST